MIHNTCEDSLLAAPLIFDLVVLCELFERIEVGVIGSGWCVSLSVAVCVGA